MQNNCRDQGCRSRTAGGIQWTPSFKTFKKPGKIGLKRGGLKRGVEQDSAKTKLG